MDHGRIGPRGHSRQPWTALAVCRRSGSGWELNPPRPATRPATGFEDQEARRDFTTPAGKHNRGICAWQVTPRPWLALWAELAYCLHQPQAKNNCDGSAARRNQHAGRARGHPCDGHSLFGSGQ